MKPRYDLPAPWSASVMPSGLIGQLQQQLLDELKQVVDLLELAPRVLVELALAGQDVQLLEQLQRLARAGFRRPALAGLAFCFASSCVFATVWRRRRRRYLWRSRRVAA